MRRSTFDRISHHKLLRVLPALASAPTINGFSSYASVFRFPKIVQCVYLLFGEYVLTEYVLSPTHGTGAMDLPLCVLTVDTVPIEPTARKAFDRRLFS